MEKKVRVLIGDNDLPVRIFRKDKEWTKIPLDKWIWMTKADAVGLIRLQVFERTGGKVFEGETVVRGKCEVCERYITWDSMEQHERIFKGKGGSVSLENCVALCHDCHQGRPDSAHGNRRWQTAKIT